MCDRLGRRPLRETVPPGGRAGDDHPVREIRRQTAGPQCRGQVEGGVEQALGAALFEIVRLDGHGAVATAAFRRDRLPQHADVPRTEVHFTETADAAGVRFTQVPPTRDRVWLRLRDAGIRRPPGSPGSR
ncbi:molybdopterin cofactor-binding domain-containing protein [Streptomyces sp. NPDC057616]|uniref:molybdopterin cofactor-binding domain-containing protein n=1 Tax=Streptomyces sp. NPDC057616 TaxID=3346183 RepID=UPI0036C5FAC2